MQHIGQNLSDEDYVAIATALSDNLPKDDDPIGNGDNGGDPIALIDSDSWLSSETGIMSRHTIPRCSGLPRNQPPIVLLSLN